MADDLVVRRVRDLAWAQREGPLYAKEDSIRGIFARAYLERDAQLAAMTAERDTAKFALTYAESALYGIKTQLTANEAEREPTFEQWQRISKAHDDHWCPATWRAMLDAALADPGKAGDTVHNAKP